MDEVRLCDLRNSTRLTACIGDNEKAFAKLGQSLELPQTATLAIQGPLVVPLLDDHEREWWPETDYMGMGER